MIACSRTQVVMRALQEIVYHHEGSVNKLSLDDKGITLLAAFGLPPLAHSDDAARGALAGLAIRDALTRLSERGAVGIATGRVYCGEASSGHSRREYTMIGDIVNFSARLMQASWDFGNVLCGEFTAQAARARVEFERLPSISLKGMVGQVPVYRPQRPAPAVPREGALFGREAERAALVQALDSQASGRGGLVLIEGAAGLGKTMLVADMIHRATVRGVIALGGPCERNSRQIRLTSPGGLSSANCWESMTSRPPKPIASGFGPGSVRPARSMR